MNNESPVFIMENMLHVRLARCDGSGCSERANPEFFAAGTDGDRVEETSNHTDLTEIMRETIPERHQPLFLKRIAELLHCAEPILPEMEDALDNLKEAFLALLRLRLAEVGIDTDTRLVLGLDRDGRLEVVDAAHPRADELGALLGHTPELEDAMREIARRTTLLRGLQDIGNAVSETSEEPDEPCHPVRTGGPYHVCLRGALSHFYFPRP